MCNTKRANGLNTTGHTHEDIDACFGNVKRVLSGRPVKTLAQFADCITYSLNGRALLWQVKDVMVIPNYQEVLGPCIDEHIGNLHKRIQVMRYHYYFCYFKPFADATPVAV